MKLLFAAIDWNAPIVGYTSEFEGLCLAIVTGIGLGIASGLVVWGLVAALKPMFRVLSSLISGSGSSDSLDREWEEYQRDE